MLSRFTLWHHAHCHVFSIHLRKTPDCPAALARSGWDCGVFIDTRSFEGDTVFLREDAEWRSDSVDVMTTEGLAHCDLQFKAQVSARSALQGHP
jgi:hypothetical protein